MPFVRVRFKKQLYQDPLLVLWLVLWKNTWVVYGSRSLPAFLTFRKLQLFSLNCFWNSNLKCWLKFFQSCQILFPLTITGHWNPQMRLSALICDSKWISVLISNPNIVSSPALVFGSPSLWKSNLTHVLNNYEHFYEVYSHYSHQTTLFCTHNLDTIFEPCADLMLSYHTFDDVSYSMWQQNQHLTNRFSTLSFKHWLLSYF